MMAVGGVSADGAGLAATGGVSRGRSAAGTEGRGGRGDDHRDAVAVAVAAAAEDRPMEMRLPRVRAESRAALAARSSSVRTCGDGCMNISRCEQSY